MSVRSFVLAAAAAAAIAVAGNASADVQNPRQVYSGFNIPELVTVASELGYQTASQTLSDGAVILKIETADVIFFVQRTVCNATTCTGLAIYAVLSPGFDVPLTTLNEYNSKQSIISVYKSENSLILTRYLIADYGAVKGNVASDLLNFNLRANEFAGFVKEGANTISAKIDSSAVAPAGAEPAADANTVPASFADGGAHGAAADKLVKELIELGGAMTLKN